MMTILELDGAKEGLISLLELLLIWRIGGVINISFFYVKKYLRVISTGRRKFYENSYYWNSHYIKIYPLNFNIKKLNKPDMYVELFIQKPDAFHVTQESLNSLPNNSIILSC